MFTALPQMLAEVQFYGDNWQTGQDKTMLNLASFFVDSNKYYLLSTVSLNIFLYIYHIINDNLGDFVVYQRDSQSEFRVQARCYNIEIISANMYMLDTWL